MIAITRRVKRLTGSLKVNMTPDMLAALEAVADRAEIPVSEVVRQCIERGLPGLRQSLRPSRQSKRPAKVRGGVK